MARQTSRRITLAALLAVAALCGRAVAQEPVYTTKMQFRIPFKIDPIERDRLGISEVRLFSSTDKGKSWKQIASASPTERHFRFEAPGEGSYWFDVRSIDRKRKMHPPGEQFTAGLKVIVDSTAPQLELEVTQSEPEQMKVAWYVDDENLDLSSLKLEYTSKDTGRWQPMAISLQASGMTTQPLDVDGDVLVRARVSDRASNVADVEQRLVTARKTDPIADESPFAEAADPFAGEESEPSSFGEESNPFEGDSPANPSSEMSPMVEPPAAATAPMSVGASSPGLGSGSLESRPGLVEAKAATHSVPVNAAPAGPPMQMASASSGAQHMNAVPFQGTGMENHLRPTAVPTQVQALPAPHAPPAHVKIVNSKIFRLDYALDDVGPSGISRVEVFVTEDNGERWWTYGDDADRRSPFELQVPREGVFGFDIRATSGAGFAAEPPQTGQRPPIVVVVDTTPPDANFLQIVPVANDRGMRQVIIPWEATDQNLTERPIALYYSVDANGPWESVSGWIPNTGSHRWNLGPGIPPRVYFRMAVRDAAGNIGHATTSEPVVVDMSRPSARILNVETMR